MAEEKDITPEEKLLKVIQSGGAAKADAAQGDKAAGSASGQAPSPPKAPQPVGGGQQTGPARPKPAASAAPVRPAAQKPPADQPASPASATQGKQEAASQQKPAAARQAGKEPKPAPEPAPAAADKAGPHAAAPKKRHGSSVSILPAVNRALGALAAALVALTAWQIWGMIFCSAGKGLNGPAAVAAPESGSGGLEPGAQDDGFDVEKIVAAYVDRNIFKYPDTGQPQQGNVQGVAATNVSVQASELAARLKLMGFTRGEGTEAEVILWDQQQSRMHIVRKGGKIIVGEKPLELVDVGRESVVLSDGKERLTVR